MSTIVIGTNAFDERVQILDASKEDANKGIARLSLNVFQRLKLSIGDVIRLFNPLTKKSTVVTLFGPIHNQDANTIKIDEETRNNLRAKVRDFVQFKKIKAELAQQVSFAALQKGVVLKNAPLLAKKLEHRVVCEGDTLTFYSSKLNLPKLSLVVVNFTPQADAVKISDCTSIFFQRKPYVLKQNTG